MKKSRVKISRATWSWELVGWLIGVVVISIFFYALTFQHSAADREAADHVGSFVAGYLGSIIALANAFLLFRTLRTQREALDRQSFETKFFFLLEIHRQNVRDLQVGGNSTNEFFTVVVDRARKIAEIIADRGWENPYAAAFDYLFYGHEAWALQPERALRRLESESGRRTEMEHLLADLRREGLYQPGLEYQLGHYYRHFYQAVCYADQQQFDQQTKYAYVKTLRAQLSNHEQAVLLLDSLILVGRDWGIREPRNQSLIKRYHLVSNLPEDFFPKKQLDVKALFRDCPDYFEWEQTG